MAHHHHENHHHHDIDKRLSKALIIGVILNLSFVILETVAGLLNNSLALLTDAGHNLSDVAGLVLIIIAGKLAKRKPTANFTYGYGKTTILAALLNASLLLIAVGAIGWEAIERIHKTEPVPGKIISIVSFIGIVINFSTALLFMKDRKKDINVKGAYLHMASDALVSLGVMVSGIIIIYTHWYWMDTLISFVIIIVILWSTWGLLKDSLRLSLDGVPNNIDVEGIRSYLLNVQGVTSLHDLHIWALSTNATALTVHLFVPADMEDSFLTKINEELHHRFQIDHTTIQIEKITAQPCEQKC